MEVRVNGEPIFTTVQVAGVPKIRMCVSNDMRKVPSTYGSPSLSLNHMEHFEAIAPKDLSLFNSGEFEPPTSIDPTLTGDPICNGARYVDTGGRK